MRKCVILMLAFGVLAYAGSFRCGWHLDDRHSITENEQIDNLSRAARLALTDNRGLVDLTFTLNHIISGEKVFGYHLLNLLFHMASSLLVFLLTSRLAGEGEKGQMAGLAAATLFLLHPLATQSVTYIVQRYTSVASFFYLLAVVFYLKGREGKRSALFLSLAAALAATRSKEIALTIPMTLLFLEYLFPHGSLKTRLLRLAPYLFIAALIPLSRVAGHFGSIDSMHELLSRGSRETVGIDRSIYLITQIHVVVTYIRLLILPVGLTLDYDYPLQTSIFSAATLLRALLLCGLILLAYRLRGRNRAAAFGIGWFFITLSVESSLIPIRDVIFEHRTYLPSFGIFLTAAALLPLPREKRGVYLAVLLMIALILGGLTFRRNRVWSNDLTLWTDCVRKAPAKSRPLANLAYANIDLGDVEGAIEHMKRSIALEPRFPEDMVILAGLLHDRGDLSDAEKYLRMAVRVDPDYGKARRNLAFLLLKKGDREEAFLHASEMVRLDPGYAEGLRFHARMLLDAGRLEESAEASARAFLLEPERGESLLLSALGAARDGRNTEAVRFVKEWETTTEPGDPDDLASIARVLHDGGDTHSAMLVLEKGLKIYPEEPNPPYLIGAILLADGDAAGAVRFLERSVSLAPDDSLYRILLARALFRSGDRDRAILEAREILRRHPRNEEALDLLTILEKRQGIE